MNSSSADQRAGAVRAQLVLVGDQRVQPVDRRELLGDRVRRGVVLLLAADDAEQRPRARRRAAAASAPTAGSAPYQLAFIAGLEHRRREDAGRPLDGVDLRHQRRVDEPRGQEQPLVVPGRVVALEVVADRVVLLDEQRVEQRQADPVVVAEAGRVDAVERRVGLVRQAAVLDDHLAVLARAQAAAASPPRSRRSASRPTSA